ncbi:hypothetical protein Tsubulata_046777 [Turnera subulata]|uniref:F-box domain-containing protein n=1 Tax=Turnera subulata TaxID=218843 RepID=A0A9Q0FU58_9ROSI|nr:hypothetical protein Tsubulata_046777 [Turnera subulata]
MSAAEGISIPLDVVTDILCCLPMKSVLRFKAVSKAWCSLIQSSYFARLHLSASMETNDGLTLVILPYVRTDQTGYVFCADFYSLDDDNDDVDDDGASSLRQNPTTNQCYSTSLAPDQTRALNRISTRSVLYHDTCSNQYKLVQAVGVGGICGFQSYNLEANGFTTFHTLPDIDDHVCHSLHSRRTLSCFVNGALHWLAPRSGDGFRSEIVALHLEMLECYKLPLVQYRYYEPTLVVFGGLLCATFSNCRDGGTRYDIDVWVMKEYGGEWTRLFNLITP